MTEPVPESPVRIEAIDVTGRLAALGVQEAVLRDAVQFGITQGFTCTHHDPPNLAGILAWGRTVRALRDTLVPQGWGISNARNYPTVVHPQDEWSLAVASGDSGTGVPDQTPSTRSAKGPVTENAVRRNQTSFADIDASFPRVEVVGPQQTWVLLFFVDGETDEVRLELSLPRAMTADGYIISWHERIILRPLPLGYEPPASEETEEIDLSIERRGE